MTALSALPPRATPKRAWRAPLSAGTATALLLAAGLVQAEAQQPPRDTAAERLLPKPRDPNAPMLVEGDQAIYDNDGQTVSIAGNATIYYDGQTLEADRITFYRQTGRVVAEGRVRLRDRDGNVIHAERLDVSRDFSRGFIQQVVIDSAKRTRFAAESAERREGNVTVLVNGVYTACTKCLETPEKPPTWQIKAAKIVHNQEEKTIYFHDASFEFFGVPLAYVPYFSAPDPTVRRKSGFLAPKFFYSTQLGAGAQVPYFWAPRDNFDVTFSPAAFTKQGPFLDIEARHKVVEGSYSIRAAGIHQLQPEAFRYTSGDREDRGAVFTKGEFRINERWKWGWDATLTSDRRVLQDYKLLPGTRYDAPSSIFLTGIGERNYFDVRGQYFRVLQDDDRSILGAPLPGGRPNRYLDELQAKQAIVHPVIDYNVIFGNPVFGGELKLDINVTSLTRDRTDWTRLGLVAGAAGTFTRTTADLNWRRQYIDTVGQVFTPFWSLRGDIYQLNPTDRLTGIQEGTAFRGMPAVGIDYSFPFLGVHSFGTQTFGPVAQFIARPNEIGVGRLPNDDAQSLVFDDTTLFERDKFSGFDRAEGGTRANVGLEWTAQALQGAALSALVGRSYHIAGDNPFLNRDPLLLGAESGLDSAQSDWVTRLYVDTATGLRFGTRSRFDDHDFQINRTEFYASALTGPVTTSLIYAFLRRQPSIGFANDREEVQGAMALQIADTWRLFGGVRYDLRNKFMVSNTVGVAYDDDSLSLSLAYAEDTDRELTRQMLSRNLRDQILFFRFGLRTLGDGTTATNLLQ